MSISKRECSKYADIPFSFNKGDGILNAEQIDHVVRTVIRNVAGRRTLIAYFFKRDALQGAIARAEYTLFQQKSDYITLQRSESGIKKWRASCIENYTDSHSRFVSKCAYYSKKDQLRVSGFCGDKTLTGIDMLISLQAKIMKNRLDAKIAAREQKIVDRMKPIPRPPRDLKGYIHREVLPQYIFYQYKRGGKPLPGYCTACRHDILVSGAKHNLSGACPRCGKAITYKARGRSGHVWDRATVQVLHKTDGDEIVLRLFKVYRALNNPYKPHTSIWESARIFIRWADAKIVQRDSYYYAYGSGKLTNWKHGDRPRFSQYQYNFFCDMSGHIYRKNLNEVLSGTPWKYCQIESFYLSHKEPMEIIPYLYAYQAYPAIEYLVKLGLTRLAARVIYGHNGAQIIKGDGKGLRGALGVEPNDLPLLQKLNVDEHQLKLYREMKKLGIRADESILVWYQRNDVYSVQNILRPLKYMTPGKLIRYLDEQFERLRGWKTRFGALRYDRVASILSEYKDYLEIGEKLGYDFSDSYVLFPRELPKDHDQANMLFNKRKNEIYNKQINEAFKKLLEQYRFSKSGLTIIPPKSAAEIVTEGHTLHHCVKNYVTSVVDGRCIILFVRRTASIKEPFYTIELQDNRIIQARGQGNCNPTPEVEKFLAVWEQRVLSKTNRTKAA